MRLCRPAPVVAMKLPIKITHSLGHAKLATTKLPPMLCPNLCYNSTRENKQALVIGTALNKILELVRLLINWRPSEGRSIGDLAFHGTAILITNSVVICYSQDIRVPTSPTIFNSLSASFWRIRKQLPSHFPLW